MNAAVGTSTGSAAGSGTVGSKADTASYASAPTAPPVKRGIPSTGTTRRRGTNARNASSGSAAPNRSIGSDASKLVDVRPAGSGPRPARRGPGAAAAARRRGTSSAPGARRPRPTRGGTPGRRRRAGGRRRSASRGRPARVARSRIVSADDASRLASPRLSGSLVIISCASGIRTTFRLRDERSSLPRCHPHSAMPHFLTDGMRLPAPIGAALYRWRSAPEPTGDWASPRVRSGGSRVHSPSPPPRFPPTTGSLCRRATGTRPVHRPCLNVARSLGGGLESAVKEPGASGNGLSNPRCQWDFG